MPWPWEGDLHREARLRRLLGGGSAFPVSEPRSVQLKGITEPMEVVSVTWRQ